ncbi:MAG: hypothetical protein CMJ76_08485 [Planctomycetaceae bacterium]|nr:hypothetical protein [Planctomycetaceae bacterium]|tara:strand:- start:1356 stop:1796 length:441 start_codon:yes stop_codon:yes gene_type:complete
MVRSIIHPLLGVFLAMLGYYLVVEIGEKLYPMNFLTNDMNQEEVYLAIQEYLATAPFEVLSISIFAPMFGTFVGTLYVYQISDDLPLAHTAPVLSVMLICTILILTKPPHPTWMFIAPLLVVGAWWNAVKLGKARAIKSSEKAKQG